MTEVPPSPFLQRCHFAFETMTDLYMVLDLIDSGDLFSHLFARTRAGLNGFPEATAAMLLAELSLALLHLHSAGYVHRDVKVENIMLDRLGHVKLVDFGLSCPLNSTAAAASKDTQPMSPTGSLLYMSPELLDEKVGGRFTDWWAFGVVAHELLTGRSPWSSLTDKPLIRREIRGEAVFCLPPHLSREATSFVLCTMERDYRRRLGTKSDAEVLSAPFFRSIDGRAAARGHLKPIFTPRDDPQRSADYAEALQEYEAKFGAAAESKTSAAAAAAVPTTPWTFGLCTVHKAPAVVAL